MYMYATQLIHNFVGNITPKSDHCHLISKQICDQILSVWINLATCQTQAEYSIFKSASNSKFRKLPDFDSKAWPFSWLNSKYNIYSNLIQLITFSENLKVDVPVYINSFQGWICTHLTYEVYLSTILKDSSFIAVCFQHVSDKL